MNKVFVFSMMCLMSIATVSMLNSCHKDKTSKDGYVNLGLPSGTQWKVSNETNSNSGDEFFTYDEAVAKFGSNLPTKKQLEELKNSCKWKWKDGSYKVTGPNGNYINLPASGYRYCGGEVYGIGSYGYYWSSSQGESDDAWSLIFNSASIYMGSYARCDGRAVRLVK